MGGTGSFYLIAHLVLFTGLTDRTIRKHIADGLLKGTKINGIWHFSPEQVESFMKHPSVRPVILAKHHGAVYDFLHDTYSSSAKTCVILNIPAEDRKTIAEFLFYHITERQSCNIEFSLDFHQAAARLILTGMPSAVFPLINDFYAAFPHAAQCN